MSNAVETASVKRGPGRPSQREQSSPSEIKKGSASWKPAPILDVTGKEDGYRYRWVNKEAGNIAKKKREQWEMVSQGTSSDNAAHVSGGKVDSSHNLTSIQETHDGVLMRIPEEIALQRDAYYNNENERRISGITAHIKDKIQKEGGKAHGKITVSSRMGQETHDLDE